MSSKNKKSAATGVRYTDAQKKEVVDFVLQYNATNGRGGQSKAAKKFKTTPLTIATWIKAAGVKKTAKPTKVAKPAKAVKAAKPAKKGKMGVRYTPEQKQDVVQFVNDYNTANGRGGQNQAAKKFKLSVLTVSAWLKAAGIKKGGVKPMAKKAAKATKLVKAVKAGKGLSELEALKAAIRALVG